jgi:hypothetical protein
MADSRVSNKQILEAIASNNEAIGNLVAALTQTAPQSATVAVQPVVQVEPEQPKAVVAPKEQTTKISAAYLAKMQPKWQAFANKVGETVIGFAYRKSNGKPGLWGCPQSEFAKVSRRESFIGAVGEYHPQ